MLNDDEYLVTEQAAKELRVSPSFLNKSRVTGDGPRFVKFGKAVRYRRADLKLWAASKVRNSTSEAA